MLEVITPASSYSLITVDDVLLDLNNPKLDEDWLDSVIAEQSSRCANWCSRSFVNQEYRLTVRMSRPTDVIILPAWPVTQIVSVTEDGNALASADWECDYTTGFLYRLINDVSADWKCHKLVVQFKGGYTTQTVPPVLKRAVKELVKGAVYHRTRDPALKALVLPGVSEEQWFVGNQSGSTLPVEIEGMLQGFRNIKF